MKPTRCSRPPRAAATWWLPLAFAVLAFLPGWQPARAGAEVLPEPGQVLVKFRPGVSEAAAQRLLNSLSGRQTGAIPQIDVRIVQVPATGGGALLAALQRHPDVEFAEVDAVVEPDFIPNDPGYASQWHLAKIQAPAAWDHTTGSSSVVLAVIDSGVDATHPDLAGLVDPGWNVYAGTSDTSDAYGHGTKVAGVAIAHGNDLAGIAAVAWQCRIMPVRVTGASGTANYSVIAQGLLYAADHGARVATISFAGAALSSTVQSAATTFAGKGGLTTASSGNTSSYLGTPDHASILVVGATTRTDTLTSYSERGPFVDLAAPGEDIYTTTVGGGYDFVSGTSFAAPLVAGVAALVFSANPALSPAEVEAILESTAVDLGDPGPDTSFGAGRVDAYQAVLASRPNSLPVPGSFSLAAYRNEARTFATAKLLNVARDADGDSLSVIAVGAASTRGGTVRLGAGEITYTPPAGFTGADAFTYTLRDGWGTTAAGTVAVSVQLRPAGASVLQVTTGPDGKRTIQSIGIPFFTYAVEASIDLQSWSQIGSVVVPSHGLFEFTDSDSTSYPIRFYRTRGL
jgi:hypothetical protein